MSRKGRILFIYFLDLKYLVMAVERKCRLDPLIVYLASEVPSARHFPDEKQIPLYKEFNQ